MKLYEIEQAMMDCVDPETGEIINEEKMDALHMAKEEKIENICLWIKNLQAEALALKTEKDNFAERERVTKNKIESLKKYISHVLDGQKFETTKVKVGYRKSESLEILESAIIPDNFLKIKTEVDKAGLKNAVKDGLEIEGVYLAEKRNISIR